MQIKQTNKIVFTLANCELLSDFLPHNWLCIGQSSAKEEITIAASPIKASLMRVMKVMRHCRETHKLKPAVIAAMTKARMKASKGHPNIANQPRRARQRKGQDYSG